MAIESFLMNESFVVIDPTLQANLEPNRDSLYQEIDQNYQGFRSCELMAIHDFDDDWSTWECHPCGDEVLVLLAGEISLQLRFTDGDQQITLSTIGQSVIVPKGIWHTAQIKVAAKVLFLTPGEKTQNRESPKVGILNP